MQVKSLEHRIILACEVETASTVQRKVLDEFVDETLVNAFFTTFGHEKIGCYPQNSLNMNNWAGVV